MDYKLLINGKFVDSPKKIEIRNPYNKELIGTIPSATTEQVDSAIRSAKKTFKITKSYPAHKRSFILEQTSNIIRQRKMELAQTIAMESGKPIKLACNEVDRAVETFKFAAEEAKRIYGESIPMDASTAGENRTAFTIREPLGAICAISPFNFPLNLVAHKVAPAIAAGNTVVLKPASYTPITAIKLGEIMLEAGLQEGALNILTGPGSTVGNYIISHPLISKITFTGSSIVGLEITQKAGIKPITLELGSNSPVIIDEEQTLQLQDIVKRCVFGSFAYSGQICISIQRIYVHRNIKKQFTELFIKNTANLKSGDQLSEDTDIGPMITEQETQRVKLWVDEAVQQGAKILIGGNCTNSIYEPTVITNTTQNMKIITDEIFAPVVSIIEFENWERMIEEVNLSNYGLNGGIYTKNIKKAMYAAHNLEIGGVIINDIPTYRTDHMPYGGVKQSGIGREGVKYAIQEMSQLKFVCFMND